LTVIFLYLSLLKLYDEKRAFFGGFFLAISYGHVFRSMANYYRGDNYMLFWYSVALLGISLALGIKKGKWKYKRLIFYTLPVLASGFSAIFWQAYYPIFAFLLSNALLLAVGAFILKKDKYLLDSIILILSTAFGVLLANYLGGIFGYGMLGYAKWLGKSVAKKLGLEFGYLKDVYLILHLKYLVPISLSFVLVLILLGFLTKDIRIRSLFLGIASFIGIIILFKRFEALKELSTGFGIFKEAPILETQPTSFKDLWAAFSLSFFLTPLFFIRFKKPRVEDFLTLGLIIPSVYMLKTWTRFLFIGSMAIAIMSGIGIVELYEAIKPRLNGKKALATGIITLVILPGVIAGLSFKEVCSLHPEMNEAWERALKWLKNNSNENDVILAWWDWGHFITYYARRSPIAQGGPSVGVALYLLGKLNENWAINLGVDYVIVSYYDFLKFGAILSTANLSKRYNIRGYGLVVLPLRASTGALIFENRGYRAIVRHDKSWNAVIIYNGQMIYPRKLYVEHKEGVQEIKPPESNSNTYLYVNLNYGYAIFMNGNAFNTTLVRLFITPEKPYKLVYSDGGLIKIFKLEHPNVKVERRESNVILNFENGTSLGLYFFLDNGTMVLSKWYNVKGKNEFIVPKVNASVARYVLKRGKKVVDRGVFRLSYN